MSKIHIDFFEFDHLNKMLKYSLILVGGIITANGCGLKVVAASKPKNFQSSSNLVGRIHFPKSKTSHPFNLLLADVFSICFRIASALS
jgi:hypothetical protein